MPRFLNTKSLFFILAITVPIPFLYAKDAPFKVLPWNGYIGAISLTYDDGDPIHLDLAIPEMNKRGIRGTFYLISGKLDRWEDWKKVAASGQEIGNHTVTHRHVAELKPEDEKNEVMEAKNKLQAAFGVPILTLAYPFVEISPGLRKWVEAENFAARGGGGNGYLTPDMDPDWYNLPSQIAMSNYTYDTYKGWVDTALADGAWTVLMIHGIEGSNMWQPIPKVIYLKFLDYLVQNKEKLWIAPFGEVCAYWRAQKILEKVEPREDGNKIQIHWDRPDPFPKGVNLQVRVPGERLGVFQEGKALKPISANTYLISFDARELTLIPQGSKEPANKGTATPVGVQ